MDTIKSLTFELLPESYAFVKLDKDARVPDWYFLSKFRTSTRNDEELSLLCDQQHIPMQVDAERDFKCLKARPANMKTFGLIANVSKIFADSQISIMWVCTYDLIYVLFREGHLQSARHALEINGHAIVSEENKTV